MNAVDLRSGLVVAALALLLITALPEEFPISECVDTVAAAGLAGPHHWGLILPNSSRLSVLTYKAIVAVRCPKLVTHTDCKPKWVTSLHILIPWTTAASVPFSGM